MPRSPYPPPAHADKGATVSSDQLIVQFHHPAYYGRLGALPFLVLPAHEQGALHHETARLACALVAGNRVDGYLSTDQKGRQPVGADPDILLNLQEYFFQVPRDQMPGWEETEGSAGYGDIGKCNISAAAVLMPLKISKTTILSSPISKAGALNVYPDTGKGC